MVFVWKYNAKQISSIRIDCRMQRKLYIFEKCTFLHSQWIVKSISIRVKSTISSILLKCMEFVCTQRMRIATTTKKRKINRYGNRIVLNWVRNGLTDSSKSTLLALWRLISNTRNWIAVAVRRCFACHDIVFCEIRNHSKSPITTPPVSLYLHSLLLTYGQSIRIQRSLLCRRCAANSIPPGILLHPERFKEYSHSRQSQSEHSLNWDPGRWGLAQNKARKSEVRKIWFSFSERSLLNARIKCATASLWLVTCV